MKAVWIQCLGLLFGGLLTGCHPAPQLAIDNRYYPAKAQNSRVQYLVLHFTNESLSEAVDILTKGEVSAHYLVSAEHPPRIYRLVDEQRRAWHAGSDSAWRGATQLNSSSIGIEIENGGNRKGPDGQVTYAPYADDQIDVLLWLIKDIVARHEITPIRIVGHSDIAPQRKVDPGPLFPWHRLADAGLIPWPDAGKVAAQREVFEAKLPDLAWFQKSLTAIGYQTPQAKTMDEPMRRVLAAFQMRYRPSNYDGIPDAETAALLTVLIQAVSR